MTICVLLKTDVSTNLVTAQPEEIMEMFEDIVKGKRVYDALGRDVTNEVIETIMDWYHYDAMKIVMENRVCEFFKKLGSKPLDIVVAANIDRYYRLPVDSGTVTKAIWTKNPTLIPVPPRCQHT